MDPNNQNQQNPQVPVSQPAQPSTPPAGDGEVMVGKYKVKVLRDVCIGAASCVAVAAQTFKLDDQNKAVVIPGSQDPSETILLAAQSCPTKAIVVIDTETNQQVWPA